jgi:hypothetical protein
VENFIGSENQILAKINSTTSIDEVLKKTKVSKKEKKELEKTLENE